MKTFFTVVFECIVDVKLIKQFVVTSMYGRKASVPYIVTVSEFLEKDKRK